MKITVVFTDGTDVSHNDVKGVRLDIEPNNALGMTPESDTSLVLMDLKRVREGKRS